MDTELNDKYKSSFQPSSTTIDNAFTTDTIAKEGNNNTEVQEKQLIQDFSGYTTLHGFHFVLESGLPWRRFLWTALIVGGLALLFTQTWISLQKLLANEVDVKKRVEINKTLPFPAVTICNQNSMRKSKIMGTIAQDYLDQQDHVKFEFTNQQQKDVPSFDVGATLQKAGHQIKQMIHTCEFAGERCEVEKVFSPTIPSYAHGLCYTFNANISTVRRVGSGRRQGLVLRFDVQPEEYYGPFSYDATGLKVAIHEPGEYHDIEKDGYEVSPGFYSSLRIKRIKATRKLPPFPSKCGSIKLMNFDKYSQNACYYECVSKVMADTCHCRVISMAEKGVNVSTYCNLTSLNSCLGPIFRQTLQEMSPETCGCPLECEAITYGVKTSIAQYPSSHLWDSLVGPAQQWTGLNATDPAQKAMIQKIIRDRNGVVSIFYENTITDVTEEKERYGLSEFGSAIGGNMGLFLGCSLLTVCEFVDLIVMLCLQRYRRNTKVTMVN